MNVLFHIGAFTEYGGNLSISPIGEFLEDALCDGDFGVSEVEVTAYFDRGKPSPGGWADSFERYRGFMRGLPRTRYEAKRRRLVLEYRSALGPVDEILDARNFVPRIFRRALGELVELLPVLESKLRKKEGLSFSGIAAVVRRLSVNLPSNDALLRRQLSAVRDRKRKRIESLPWHDRLGIDWTEFHPIARDVLSDPFFWDCADDNAPHGNDTGADLFEAFKKWRARNKKAAPQDFLDKLLRSWGVNGGSAGSRERGQELPRATVELTQDEASIALAFALIKLEGKCDAITRKRAVKAIERQSHGQSVAQWRSAKERRRALNKMRAKLEAPTGA